MVEEIKVPANRIGCLKECHLSEKPEGDPDLLSKWRKSAAHFQPSCRNHLSTEFTLKKSKNSWKRFEDLHDREVLDAAEALTYLSRAPVNKT